MSQTLTPTKTVPTPATITKQNYPALFQNADKQSIDTQATYKRVMKINLGLTIFSALIVAYVFTDPVWKNGLAVISSLCLALSLILFYFIRHKQWDKGWYSARSIAEGVKSSAWYYMMGVAPYPQSLSAAEVDSQFTTDLGKLLEKGKIQEAKSESGQPKPQISETMRQVRASSFDERKRLYFSQRVHDQQAWYAEKATTHRTKEKSWFVWVFLFQILALFASVSLILLPSLPFKLTGVFTTLASSALAWVQVQRHNDSAQSYDLMAQKLSLLAERERHVTTEEELAAFVFEAETMLTQEHSLWVARRS